MTVIERAAMAVDEWIGDIGTSREIARAVLLAIREPSKAQIDRFVSRALCVTVHGDGGWSNYAREQWQAMVDGALKEPE